MPLQRVLEPEFMDTAEEARDYDRMDHAEVNRAFVDDFLETGFQQGLVLDLGTGTALIPIQLCRQTTRCRVMAVDMAVHMLDLARYNVEAAGLGERVMLAQVDAKQLPYPQGKFDAVISNSIVHHIPEPAAVLGQAMLVTRPGGRLFFRDLLRPGSDQEVGQLVEQYSGEENEHSREMFEASLRAALSLDEIRELIQQLGYDRQSVQQTTDRHWTWSTRR